MTWCIIKKLRAILCFQLLKTYRSYYWESMVRECFSYDASSDVFWKEKENDSPLVTRGESFSFSKAPQTICNKTKEFPKLNFLNNVMYRKNILEVKRGSLGFDLWALVSPFFICLLMPNFCFSWSIFIMSSFFWLRKYWLWAFVHFIFDKFKYSN
jgi:hypothetical protein